MAAAPPDLVIEGQVAAIEPVAGGGHQARWRVRVAVERVVLGRFDPPVFEFAVHSPVKSGLAEGQALSVAATRVGDGYQVDPLQWRRTR